MTRRRATASRSGRPLTAAVVGVVALWLVSAATAAAPLAYVTPASIAAKIRGTVPQIPTDNTSPPSTITAMTCKGLPPAHAKKFNTFRCSATWDQGKATVWARALPGGKYCASSTGLASCPATPAAPGDPRICALSPAPPTGDPNRCALGSTLLSITRAMPVKFGDPAWTIRNAACKGTNLKRSCTFSSLTAFGIYYTSAVTFKQAADGAWTATLVTTGGGSGSFTCTVQPGPPGSTSRWRSGPAPTCSTV